MLGRKIIINKHAARAIMARAFHTRSAVQLQAQTEGQKTEQQQQQQQFDVAVSEKVHPLEATRVEDAPFKPSGMSCIDVFV